MVEWVNLGEPLSIRPCGEEKKYIVFDVQKKLFYFLFLYSNG